MNKTEVLIAALTWCRLRKANNDGRDVVLDKEAINVLLNEHDEYLETLKSANEALAKANYTMRTIVSAFEEAK